MRLAIISLIFKKGDRLLLKNWRPISLLNVDYKIGAKVLATRLKSVLPSLLNPDQTCNVPRRTIVDSLCLIRDSITYVNQKQIPLALIKIDLILFMWDQQLNNQFIFSPETDVLILIIIHYTKIVGLK